MEPGRSAASRCDVMWSEDGFMKAGFRPKGQGYRASPPAHLQEALARQRHLLHGQDLRNYWNLPKVRFGCCVLCLPGLQMHLLLELFPIKSETMCSAARPQDYCASTAYFTHVSAKLQPCQICL